MGIMVIRVSKVGYRYLLINSAKILKQTYYIDCYKDYIVTILKYTKINSMYFSIETIHDEILWDIRSINMFGSWFTPGCTGLP